MTEFPMRNRIALLAALLAATPALAQQTPPAPQPGEELWDGVVAVVGDTVLLRSDLLITLEQMRANNQPVPQDPAQYETFMQQLVEERVSDLLLLEAARAAGVGVSEAEVASAVDEQIEQVRQRFGGEAAFQQALAASGRTAEAYRAELTAQYRDQTQVQRYIRQQMGTMAPPAVSAADINTFFEANRERFGTRPASVSFQQVLIRPVPSDSARQAAIRTMEQVQRELQQGGDFAVLARRYSQDGTRERGGDLGWFRQGQMVRQFNDAVFSMRPGQVSPIVETEFGFHIIKLEKVRGPERQARHILVRPVISQGDISQARVRADSVAQAVRGGASATELASRYNTPDEARVQRDVPLDRLQPLLLTALQSAEPGTVVGPVQLDLNGTAAFSVARVTGRQTQGQYTVDEQRDRIRTVIQEQRMMERLLEQLRRDMHVSIRS